MKLEVPYGKETVTVSIPDSAEVAYPNEVKIRDESQVLASALAAPINSKSFRDFLADARDVLIIINDATRPTPTARVLDIIRKDLEGINAKYIIATGVHRACTENELREIFGSLYTKVKDKIIMHDAARDEDMVNIGTSANGTEMYVNRAGVEAHKIVIIGSVEPHYFAGYTGGRKAFLPGIASRRTIEQNHKYALRPEAQALKLDGNPVHEDMIDALKIIADKEIFSIMTVLDGEHRIYATTAGHIHDSFYAAIAAANEVFCVPVKGLAEVVVSVAPYPMDIDLYQSQKALDNGKLAMADGAILILVSKCRMGVGDDAFLELLGSCATPQDTLEKLASGYKLGWHKAGKMAEIAIKGEMWGVTDLDDKTLEKAFIKPYKSLQQAIDDALAKKGAGARLLVLMNGSMSIPMIRS
ncbi:MAG: nickel-dependent lactate racemase [Candidatus Eisenbacteria bacterium]|nr:nickel-dependent lactate racemase [Candidatus Eisenbacteria bacterium]